MLQLLRRLPNNETATKKLVVADVITSFSVEMKYFLLVVGKDVYDIKIIAQPMFMLESWRHLTGLDWLKTGSFWRPADNPLAVYKNKPFIIS